MGKFNYTTNIIGRRSISTRRAIYHRSSPKVSSLSHYQHYIKDRIIKESLHTLDYYNFKYKLRYKHAELQMAKFAKIWLERYYSYGGQGYLKLQKRWNREIISK